MHTTFYWVPFLGYILNLSQNLQPVTIATSNHSNMNSLLLLIISTISLLLSVDSRALSSTKEDPTKLKTNRRAFFYAPTPYRNTTPDKELPEISQVRKRSVDGAPVRHHFFFKPPRIRDNHKKSAKISATRRLRPLKVHLAASINRESRLLNLGEIVIERTNSPDIETAAPTDSSSLPSNQPPTSQSPSNQPHTLTVVY